MFNINNIKKHLLDWCAWFFLGNVLILWLIGFIYLPSVAWQDVISTADWLLILSYMGHFSLLSMLPCFIIIPLIFLLPSNKFIAGISILSATLMTSFLMIDALTYHVYHFHVNKMVLTLFVNGLTQDMLGLSWSEKFAPIMILMMCLLFESIYARWLWQYISKNRISLRWFKWIIGFLSLCLFLSYSNFISTNTARLRISIQNVRFIPLYIEVLKTILPKKNLEMVLLRLNNEDPMNWIHPQTPLNYPKQPLTYVSSKPASNLLIISIDSWRYDMLNDEVTPYLNGFTNYASQFKNHFSGGNSTGPGIFTLFYGVPATYTQAMETQHRGPILLDELMNQHYQLGIYSSAPLYSPPMHRSVFQSIKNLSIQKQPGQTVFERDRSVTQKFKNFIETLDQQKPFFSFLFYDAAHSYCGNEESIGPFQPTIRYCNRLAFDDKRDREMYFNRYKNAVYSIDKQIKQAIDVLAEHKLLNNTIVVVVGDHGEEFNDNNNGYLGHASNYTRYQTQTPLIIYWPNQKANSYTHKTSHFDLVPTLMANVLGCQNASADYSVGINLFDSRDRPYFIISSYSDFGVVEPERITTIFPNGNYQIATSNGSVAPDDKINLDIMRQAFDDLRRFYVVG